MTKDLWPTGGQGLRAVRAREPRPGSVGTDSGGARYQDESYYQGYYRDQRAGPCEEAVVASTPCATTASDHSWGRIRTADPGIMSRAAGSPGSFGVSPYHTTESITWTQLRLRPTGSDHPPLKRSSWNIRLGGRA